MQLVYGIISGGIAGLFVGGFLAYKYADKLVAKAVAEYQKAVALEERIRRAL